MPTEGCSTSQGSMRRAASSTGSHAGMPGTHAVTHMRSHAHRAVPVTSFLGDSAQLESHTSECPESESESERQQERRTRGGERTVRQAGGPGRAAGAALGRAEGGGGAGTISWPWAGCWAWA